MELRVLKYFLAVVQEDSMTKTAEAVHTSQPNRSRQMNALEDKITALVFLCAKYVLLQNFPASVRRISLICLSGWHISSWKEMSSPAGLDEMYRT